MPNIHSRILTGRIGEDCAARYIERNHGWEILGRNVRLHTGEIDIVAKDKRTIIFIEVKAGRGHNEELRPEQHVDFRKAQKLRTVCREYLLANRYPETTDWRIDIAAVAVDDGGKALIRYYPNAIEE